jgi:hypothetical protein
MKNQMKAKIVSVLCCAALLMSTATTVRADSSDGLAVVADVVILRPACLVATVVGSAFFVVSLPFAAMSKSVKRSAHALVVVPAQATFTRPLGELDSLTDY